MCERDNRDNEVKKRGKAVKIEMKETGKRTMIRVLALVLAFVLVGFISVISRNTSLKASEDGMEEVFVEEIVEGIGLDGIYEEPVYEEPAIEEPAAEEPVMEEPVIEEPVAEEPVIEEPAIEEEEPETVNLEVVIWFECPDGVIDVGSTIIWKSEVLNAPEGVELAYRWQENRGSGWEDIVGENGPEYVMTVTEENMGWLWRVTVSGK